MDVKGICPALGGYQSGCYPSVNGMGMTEVRRSWRSEGYESPIYGVNHMGI